MDIKKMLRSFRYAAKGIVVLIKSENNAGFHLFFAVIVILCGFYFRIETWEWVVVSMSIAMVFATEAINTAIEKFCDLYHPEKHSTIGCIKDLSAAGVLFMALSSLVVAILVFGKRFYVLFSS